VPELVTRKTKESIAAFLKKAVPVDRHADCKTLVKIMEKATGDKAAMWGTAIIGCGSHPITYANGDVLDWPAAAFSPRKSALTIYGTKGSPKFAALLKRLGKHKMVGGCLHIKKLADVDEKVLAELIETAVAGGKAKSGKRS
jgi:hypothetical protein